MIYHLRYYWLVFCRLVRMPFCRWARNSITLDELIADYERDPELRQLLKEARVEIGAMLK